MPCWRVLALPKSPTSGREQPHPHGARAEHSPVARPGRSRERSGQSPDVHVPGDGHCSRTSPGARRGLGLSATWTRTCPSWTAATPPGATRRTVTVVRCSANARTRGTMVDPRKVCKALHVSQCPRHESAKYIFRTRTPIGDRRALVLLHIDRSHLYTWAIIGSFTVRTDGPRDLNRIREAVRRNPPIKKEIPDEQAVEHG